MQEYRANVCVQRCGEWVSRDQEENACMSAFLYSLRNHRFVKLEFGSPQVFFLLLKGAYCPHTAARIPGHAREKAEKDPFRIGFPRRDDPVAAGRDRSRLLGRASSDGSGRRLSKKPRYIRPGGRGLPDSTAPSRVHDSPFSPVHLKGDEPRGPGASARGHLVRRGPRAHHLSPEGT